MFRLIMAVLLAVATASAYGKAPKGADVPIEASMLVTGNLVIEPDGSVSSHEIDRASEVPDYVRAYIDRVVATWRFEPVEVDGQVVRAQVRTTMRMLATPVGDDDFQISLAGATFGDREAKDTDHVSRLKMLRPKYPPFALSVAASGTVYLVLRVGRDGRVMDAFPEQVNLRVSGDQKTMDRVREEMADAAIKASRHWSFAPPTTGEWVDEPWWAVRVPVSFSVRGHDRLEQDAYGQWLAYVPGPRQDAPWRRKSGFADSDAIADGALHQEDSRFRLLTPLQPQG